MREMWTQAPGWQRILAVTFGVVLAAFWLAVLT